MSESTICVSVILPVYNSRDYIQDAVESILQQTLKELELIVIDDASTDGTQAIIRQFDDSRIVFIQKEKNTGYTQSLNRGLGIAKGEYIARMDADDISLPGRLERQVAFLNANPDMIFCGTDFEIMGTPRKVLKGFFTHEQIITAMLLYTPVIHPTVMFRGDFIRKNNIRYDPSFEPSEDFELWVRLAGQGKIAIIPEVLLKYRHHSEQVSSKADELQQSNLRRSRIRLLSYLTGPLAGKEQEYAEMLFGSRNVNGKEELRNLFKWVDRIIQFNDTSPYFLKDLFRNYLFQLRKKVVKKSFLGRSKYTMSDIPDLLFASRHIKKDLGFWDGLKYIIKSIFFWRSRKEKNRFVHQ